MKKVIASIMAVALVWGNAAFLPNSFLVSNNVVISVNSLENEEYDDLEDIFYAYVERKQSENQFIGGVQCFVNQGDVAYGVYGRSGSMQKAQICVITSSGVNEITENSKLYDINSIMPFSIGDVKFVAAYGMLNSNGFPSYAISIYRIADDKPELTRLDGLRIDTEVECDDSYTYYYKYDREIVPNNRSTDVKDYITVNSDSIIFDNAEYIWDYEKKTFFGIAISYEELVQWYITDKYEDGTKVGYYYAICDMDNDGVTEFLINSGTCEADMTVSMFTYDGLIPQNIAEFPGLGFHTGSFMINDEGKVVLIMGTQGLGDVYTFTKSGFDVKYSEKKFEYTNDFETAKNKTGIYKNIDNRYIWGTVSKQGFDYLMPLDYSFVRKKAAYEESFTIAPNTNSTISESDKEMISEVTKYCSDKDYEFRDRINEVLASNTGWEIKQNELLKILSSYGVNDIQEGMTYIINRNQRTSDALPYIWNYEFLVNNQVYCSSNFYDWLMSSEGMGARLSLQTSSLIFNHEIMDVAFGDLFSDDPISSNPSAKRNKKMLIDFLQNLDSDNNDSFGDKLKEASDLTEVFGKEFELSQEYNKDFKAYVDAMSKTDKGVTLYLPNLSSFLGYSSATFKFAGATINDVEILANMDNQVAIYERNRKFLETIRDSRSVSKDMRIAANSLLDDITDGFNKTIGHIFGSACQFVTEMQLAYFDKDMWAVAMEELGIENASSYIATYSVGVFITNALTGINKFTEEVAYSLGYAELSKLYSQELKKDKEKFLKEQSKDNAWKFFEDYTILWNLRYSGEEQYLKSQKVEGLFSSVKTTIQYIAKTLIVEETLKRLESAKFHISKDLIIPESVQYMKKAIISCPVDIYVYKGSDLVATLKDGEESDITNSYGRFAVVYNPCTEEYEKVICQSTGDDLSIKIVAVDTGIVNAALAHLDSSDNLKIRSFDNEPITKEDIIELSTDITNNNYTIDNSGDGKIDATKSLNEVSSVYTPVTKITSSNDSIELVVGECMALEYSVSPDNATYKSVEFTSDDPNIVEVESGKIIAKSVGSTTISVISSDNNNIKLQIKVTVTEKNVAKIVSKRMIVGGIIVVVIVIGGIILFMRRKNEKR